MGIIDFILYSIVFLWTFWALYVFVMGIYRAYLSNRLTPITMIFATPFVLIAYIIDIVCNLTIASIIFWQPPQEALVTTRLKKIIASNNQDSWRFKLASYICDHLLDIFDPTGNHC